MSRLRIPIAIVIVSLLLMIPTVGILRQGAGTLGTEVPSPTLTLTATQTETPTATVTPTETATVTASPTTSLTATATLSPLETFIEECRNPFTRDISCIYAEDKNGKVIMALHLQRGDWYPGDDTILPRHGAMVWTQAWTAGEVIGIIAHDGLDGQKFYQLYGRVIIDLIWTTGEVWHYGINSQDLWRNVGAWYTFEPWDGGARVSDTWILEHYYRNGNHFGKMVLQTCYRGHEGIFFVVAYRLADQP